MLLQDLDDLVNELDRGTTLALGLAHNLGVATLVCLDWRVSEWMGSARTMEGSSQWRRSIMLKSDVAWYNSDQVRVDGLLQDELLVARAVVVVMKGDEGMTLETRLDIIMFRHFLLAYHISIARD